MARKNQSARRTEVARPLRTRRKESGFDQQKIADDQCIHAGAEITADSVARRNYQRLAEQIEGSVQQNRRVRLLAECFQKSPIARIHLAPNDVQADSILRYGVG